MVTGIAPAAATAGAHDVAQQDAVHRERGSASLAGDLGDWATEVHVDVVHADLAHQEPHRLAERAGVGAVQLH